MRDYACLCAVFIVLYGAAGMFTIPSMRVGLMYLAPRSVCWFGRLRAIMEPGLSQRCSLVRAMALRK